MISGVLDRWGERSKLGDAMLTQEQANFIECLSGSTFVGLCVGAVTGLLVAAIVQGLRRASSPVDVVASVVHALGPARRGSPCNGAHDSCHSDLLLAGAEGRL